MLLSRGSRFCILILSVAIFSPSGARAQSEDSAVGDCFGFCGFQSLEGCWCDAFCIITGDCCDDRCEYCSGDLNNCDISPPPPYDFLQLSPPALAPPDDSCIIDVFDDKLDFKWEDWSYFSEIFLKAKKSFQGNKAIRIKLQEFGAFRLHAKIDISLFDVLELWISRKVSKKEAKKLSGPPEIDLNIILGIFPQPKFLDAIANYKQGQYSGDILEWTKFSVPIPQNLGKIKDVLLQNPTTEDRKYFVDSITLFANSCQL